MNPRVTLAIPTLNRPSLLRETLLCALAQDYENLEILISDNGSHDETPTLVASMIKDDPRARFRRNEVTVPSHEHFSQCLHSATGDFFIILCDDDCINSRFVSELADVAARHPRINVVVPANLTIDEDGVLIKEFSRPNCELFNGADFLCRHWLYWDPPQAFISFATFMARTKVLRRFGGYQPFARGLNMDNLLFLQCAITGKVGFARNAEFRWRICTRSFGFSCPPKDIARSSRQFTQHLRHDARTKEALSRLPFELRQKIINGVHLVTAQEFLSRVGFFEQPFNWTSIRNMFVFRWNRAFCYIVLRHYYCWFRALCRSVIADRHRPRPSHGSSDVTIIR